jgi:hypothetical protein
MRGGDWYKNFHSADSIPIPIQARADPAKQREKYQAYLRSPLYRAYLPARNYSNGETTAEYNP